MVLLSLHAVITAARADGLTFVDNGVTWRRIKVCQKSRRLESGVRGGFIIDGRLVKIKKEKRDNVGEDSNWVYKNADTLEIIKIVKPPKEKDTVYVGADD